VVVDAQQSEKFVRIGMLAPRAVGNRRKNRHGSQAIVKDKAVWCPRPEEDGTSVVMVRRLTLKAADAFHKDYDLVIDGSDNFDTRYLINDAGYLAGKANVHGSGGAVSRWKRYRIAAHQRELDATPVDNRARREMREWQIRRDKKRLAEIEAALRPEP
jgi:ThiF family